MSRNRLWTIAIAFMAVALVIEGWSPPAAVLFVVAGLIFALSRALKKRPNSGPWSFSIDCQRCGAPLQLHVGFPSRTCSQCGHRQSWAR